MNATATPVPELVCQLLDAADGIPADAAAAGLIISHGHFLHRDAFRRTITTGTSISTGEPLAINRLGLALHAVTPGRCLRILRAGDPADRRQPRRSRHRVRLRTVLGNLDPRKSPCTCAITTANG